MLFKYYSPDQFPGTERVVICDPLKGLRIRFLVMENTLLREFGQIDNTLEGVRSSPVAINRL